MTYCLINEVGNHVNSVQMDWQNSRLKSALKAKCKSIWQPLLSAFHTSTLIFMNFKLTTMNSFTDRLYNIQHNDNYLPELRLTVRQWTQHKHFQTPSIRV